MTATPAGSSLSRLGATLERGNSKRWSSRAILGVERIVSSGLIPTAAVIIHKAQLGRLSIACCPPSYWADGISHALLANLLTGAAGGGNVTCRAETRAV